MSTPWHQEKEDVSLNKAFHTWQSYRTTVSSRQTVSAHRDLVSILSYIQNKCYTHIFWQRKSSDLVVNEKLWSHGLRWTSRWVHLKLNNVASEKANSSFPSVCSGKVRWCSEGVAETPAHLLKQACALSYAVRLQLRVAASAWRTSSTLTLFGFFFWYYWHCVIWRMTPWGNSKLQERLTWEHFQSNGHKKPVVQFSGPSSPARRDGALDYLPHHSLPGVLNWNMDYVSFSSNPFISNLR